MSSSLTFQLRQQQQQEQQLQEQQEEQQYNNALLQHEHVKQDNATQRQKPRLPPSFKPRQDKPLVPVNLPSPPNSSYGEDDGLMSAKSLSDESLLNVRRDSLPTHFSAMTLRALSTSLPENYTIDHSSPIQIQNLRRSSQAHPHLHSPSAVSTVTAAATGGRSHRHRRGSETTRKSRLSESPAHRCDDCGKVYKHPSCLSKHRWEHSEEWELTSKLLLTKHQQVQMLEAAAILVGMDPRKKNDDPTAAIGGTEAAEDEEEEGSPIQVDDEGDDDDDILIDMDQDDDAVRSPSERPEQGQRQPSQQQRPQQKPLQNARQVDYLRFNSHGSTPAKLPTTFHVK